MAPHKRKKGSAEKAQHDNAPASPAQHDNAPASPSSPPRAADRAKKSLSLPDIHAPPSSPGKGAPKPANVAKDVATPRAKKGKKRRWIFGHPFQCCGILAAFVVLIAILVATVPDNFLPQEGANLRSTIRDSYVNSTSFALPGKAVKQEGVRARAPLVFIPGLITTGLELWDGNEDCFSGGNFRQRVWGQVSMVQQFVMNKWCWLKHMSLDKKGRDPPGIKVRPADGLEAADYPFPGYWVWGKVIENLSVIGYDSNSMHMAAYDWRLGFKYLEERDRYFTRLRVTIELMFATNGDRKVVVITHSLGSNVFYYFLKWVESPNGGDAGDGWVEKYIDTFVNIGGPLLGVAKSISTAASGEMKDTAPFAFMEELLMDNVFSRYDRTNMVRSWMSSWSMFPKGGEAVWGDIKQAPDDNPEHSDVPSYGSTIRFTSPHEDHIGNWSGPVSVTGVFDWFRHIDPEFMEAVEDYYSFGATTDFSSSKYINDQRYWSNPLESQLPDAPSMRILCMYGVGKATERAYNYRPYSGKLQYVLDTSVSNVGNGIAYGVQYERFGDGTVPLLSLGYMCAGGWRHDAFNPSGIKTVVREYRHEPDNFQLRGGIGTADHVDIMGNHEMIMDLLRWVGLADAERREFMGDRLFSNITRIAASIDKRLGLPKQPKHNKALEKLKDMIESI